MSLQHTELNAVLPFPGSNPARQFLGMYYKHKNTQLSICTALNKLNQYPLVNTNIKSAMCTLTLNGKSKKMFK